jgi:mono/diheme cytochrome c family protein
MELHAVIMQYTTNFPSLRTNRVKFSRQNKMHQQILRRWNKNLAIRVGMTALVAIAITWFIRLDVSSEAEPPRLETGFASTLLALKLRLKNPPKDPPLSPTPDDLQRGAELYHVRCAFCHGDFEGPLAPLAKSFSPRPPQFAIEPSHRPVWMNVDVIRHGIRWTAMPAFPNLPEPDAWRIALYLQKRTQPNGP